MADETIMYQSLLLLGIIAFGAFSLTLDNFNDRAQTNVLVANLNETLADIGSKITELITRGEKLASGATSTFSLSIILDLPDEFGNSPYWINATSLDSEAYLAGVDPFTEQTLTTTPLGFNTTEILFSGTLFSTSGKPTISYTWNGTTFSFTLFNQ